MRPPYFDKVEPSRREEETFFLPHVSSELQTSSLNAGIFSRLKYELEKKT